MAPPSRFSFALASALLTASAKTSGTAGSSGTPPYTVTLGEEPVCLSDINDARAAAGLEHFATPSDGDGKGMWPQITNTEANDKSWYPVCEALIKADGKEQRSESDAVNSFKTGTYAYMALPTADADCATAVEHWKAAFSNFTTTPPSKTQGSELYSKQQNISFVAMYNPTTSATADCRVVTCAKAATSRSQTESKTGHALLCTTTPDAFTDGTTPPFTEDQWSKITASLTGSSSVVAPSLLVFAAAAFGLAAL
ncbi:SAG family member [Eimeria brunetti]|uniref:SAG family member n=1 Tax=Eimeria brunetti TaxID=51314 RepID=U6L8Y9_9EIME|nr:SAG family member [Eimeria brunetti]